MQGREDLGKDLLHRFGNDFHSSVKVAVRQPIEEGIDRDEFTRSVSLGQVGVERCGHHAGAEPAANFDNARRSVFADERVSYLGIDPLKESIVVVIMAAVFFFLF